jgi:undecaprenol kinase
MEQEDIKTIEQIKSKNRFSHAFRGVYVFWQTTRNLKIHLFFGLLAVFMGFYFCISAMEWVALVLVIGLVLITEALNTALEIDMDLTSPKYHPFARDTKDVAAGAVLLSSVTAIVVGGIIFIPKILIMTP